jgi:hypothetical protein
VAAVVVVLIPLLKMVVQAVAVEQMLTQLEEQQSLVKETMVVTELQVAVALLAEVAEVLVVLVAMEVEILAVLVVLQQVLIQVGQLQHLLA